MSSASSYRLSLFLQLFCQSIKASIINVISIPVLPKHTVQGLVPDTNKFCIAFTVCKKLIGTFGLKTQELINASLMDRTEPKSERTINDGTQLKRKGAQNSCTVQQTEQQSVALKLPKSFFLFWSRIHFIQLQVVSAAFFFCNFNHVGHEWSELSVTTKLNEASLHSPAQWQKRGGIDHASESPSSSVLCCNFFCIQGCLPFEDSFECSQQPPHPKWTLAGKGGICTAMFVSPNWKSSEISSLSPRDNDHDKWSQSQCQTLCSCCSDSSFAIPASCITFPVSWTFTMFSISDDHDDVNVSTKVQGVNVLCFEKSFPCMQTDICRYFWHSRLVPIFSFYQIPGVPQSRKFWRARRPISVAWHSNSKMNVDVADNSRSVITPPHGKASPKAAANRIWTQLQSLQFHAISLVSGEDSYTQQCSHTMEAVRVWNTMVFCLFEVVMWKCWPQHSKLSRWFRGGGMLSLLSPHQNKPLQSRDVLWTQGHLSASWQHGYPCRTTLRVGILLRFARGGGRQRQGVTQGRSDFNCAPK